MVGAGKLDVARKELRDRLDEGEEDFAPADVLALTGYGGGTGRG